MTTECWTGCLGNGMNIICSLEIWMSLGVFALEEKQQQKSLFDQYQMHFEAILLPLCIGHAFIMK